MMTLGNMREALPVVASVTVVLIGVVGATMILWIATQRPAWWQVKNAIYYGLCGIGLTMVWLVAIAFIQNTFFMLASFCIVIYLSWLAKEKFNQ